MKYTSKQFGLDLKKQLQHSFAVHEISQWAYLLGIDKHREIDSDLDKIIQQIAVMSEGPQFEFSEQELLDLANSLIANEE